LYLPDVPGVGEAYVDFRYCVTVHRQAAVPTARVASMTEAARERLYAQLLVYYTRRDFKPS
jgi:hypothetical protein